MKFGEKDFATKHSLGFTRAERNRRLWLGTKPAGVERVYGSRPETTTLATHFARKRTGLGTCSASDPGLLADAMHFMITKAMFVLE